MRIMAGFVIISVVVACCLRQVLAVDCSMVNVEDLRSCNDCIRCGGHWCIKGEKQHCSSSPTDDWCPGYREALPLIPQESVAGAAISPRYYATTANVGLESPRVNFKYNWIAHGSNSEPNVELTVVNTTQTKNYDSGELRTVCENGQCTTHVTVVPKPNFCLDDGSKFEFLHMRVRVENVTEEAAVKYHVPCACACSDKVERNSHRCNGNGDFSCGVCNCHKGWTGETCLEKPKCEGRRGDVQCTNPYKNDVTCSGNGECGPCDTCICYDKGEGSQYFDPNEYCADLGLIVTSYCEICLRDLRVTDGQCQDCTAIVQPCNDTLLSERDERDRSVWVQFEDSDGAEYAAMKDEDGQIYIMRKSFCSGYSGAVTGTVNVTVPAVLGVLALVCAAAGVAGYLVWKARAAPAPLNASQYQELDAPENSAGINPLYKSPTSSYNNPMWKGGAKV